MGSDLRVYATCLVLLNEIKITEEDGLGADDVWKGARAVESAGAEVNEFYPFLHLNFMQSR